MIFTFWQELPEKSELRALIETKQRLLDDAVTNQLYARAHELQLEKQLLVCSLYFFIRHNDGNLIASEWLVWMDLQEGKLADLEPASDTGFTHLTQTPNQA
jgi:hypothetical protein